MKFQKYCHKPIFLIVLAFGILTSCQWEPVPTQVGFSSTPIASATSPINTLTDDQEHPSSPSETQYHLTFVTQCQEESQCMHEINIGCLESQQPCISEDQLLFEVSKQSQGPRPPIYPYDWSPDGQMVAIEATGVKGKGDIFVGDWKGQNWTNITNSPTYEGGPAWLPDGRHIAFAANSGEPSYLIQAFWVTPEGQDRMQIMQALDITDAQQFSWSPNGERVAFAHYDENGYSQIYIANSDGSNVKQLTDQFANHFQPNFSSDGYLLAAIRQPEGSSDSDEIILLSPDSSNELEVILKSNGSLFTPVWSPNGNWIAFTSDINGFKAIYLIHSNGTGLTQVTQGSADAVAPAWRIISP